MGTDQQLLLQVLQMILFFSSRSSVNPFELIPDTEIAKIRSLGIKDLKFESPGDPGYSTR